MYMPYLVTLITFCGDITQEQRSKLHPPLDAHLSTAAHSAKKMNHLNLTAPKSEPCRRHPSPLCGKNHEHAAEPWATAVNGRTASSVTSVAFPHFSLQSPSLALTALKNQKKPTWTLKEIGGRGDGRGREQAQKTTIDSHSFDNAFPTLTPGHPSTTSREPRPLLFLHDRRHSFVWVRQTLARGRQRQEQRGDRENDRADRGVGRGVEGEKGRDKWMERERSCSPFVWHTLPLSMCFAFSLFVVVTH